MGWAEGRERDTAASAEPGEPGRVWRGHFVCMALEGGLERVTRQEFATLVVPEPGEPMRLRDAQGRVLMSSDEVVATLFRQGRLYIRTRSETYRIVPADAAPCSGATGEFLAITDDEPS